MQAARRGFLGLLGAVTLAEIASSKALFLRGGRVAAGSAPTISVAPTVAGGAPQGSILTCGTGTWNNSPTSYSYQWIDNGSNIIGATSFTFNTASITVGHAVACKVTAINAAGSSAPATSSNSITVAAASTKLAPSAQWSGVPNSGYGGANPAKPTPGTRTNTRPSCRPLFIQHTFVTGVDATDGSDWVVFASRCYGGVAYVRIWLEGNYIDVTARRWVAYTDARGTARLIYGFAVQLDYTAAQAAHANGAGVLVAQAFANNGTYQTACSPDRTVHFRPGAALTAGSRYDEVKTVGSGGDYASLPLALTYVAAQATANPNKYIGLKIITSGFHAPECSGGNELLVCNHATEVFANSGVTADMGRTTGSTYCTLDGTRFFGPGIRIDTCPVPNPSLFNALIINNDSGSGHLIQGLGIEVYTGTGGGNPNYSGSGAALLYNGEQQNQTWFGNSNGVGGSHIEWKDLYLHDVSAYGLFGAESIINCDGANVSGSGWENCWGVIHGGTMSAIGGYASGLRQQKAAITIAYGGGGGTASYSVTSTSNGSAWPGNGNNGYLNLYVAGVFVQSFSTATYSNSSLMSAAINAYGNGFSCTFDATNAARGTNYLSRTGLQPTDPLYPAVSFSAGSAALTTIYDIHANAIVVHDGTYSNAIVEFVNQDTCYGTAPFSNDNSATMIDFHYGNLNCLDTSSSVGIDAQRGYLNGTWTHVGYEDITICGLGAGCYISGADCDATSFQKNGYWTTIYYAHAAYPLMNWQGLVVNINTLPSGANSGNYSSVQAATESTFISTSTGVPVLNGALKNSNGAYCSALVPTSLRVDSPTGNYGWNITG